MTTTPAVGHISSLYGKRKRPRKADGTYGSAYHRGVDIGGPASTPVVAPEAGTVTYIARTALRGLFVDVDHGRYRTRHQHLDSVTVHQGQQVAEGQQIGVMGTSGGVARHLHTEVHDGTTPIDPTPWYAARGVTLGVARAGAPHVPTHVGAAPGVSTANVTQRSWFDMATLKDLKDAQPAEVVYFFIEDDPNDGAVYESFLSSRTYAHVPDEKVLGSRRDVLDVAGVRWKNWGKAVKNPLVFGRQVPWA